MNPDPVCSQRSDPDPVQIGPDPQHWIRVMHILLQWWYSAYSKDTMVHAQAIVDAPDSRRQL
jgi:hypothetical protein